MRDICPVSEVLKMIYDLYSTGLGFLTFLLVVITASVGGGIRKGMISLPVTWHYRLGGLTTVVALLWMGVTLFL
jgi:hypothetical protein